LPTIPVGCIAFTGLPTINDGLFVPSTSHHEPGSCNVPTSLPAFISHHVPILRPVPTLGHAATLADPVGVTPCGLGIINALVATAVGGVSLLLTPHRID
jgi:hypothetical protein